MKRLLISILSVVIVLLFAVTAYAVTFQTTHVNLTIVPSTPEVKVFTDPECTVPLQNNLYWGEQLAGTTMSLTLYVKNVGGVTTNVNPELNPATPYSWGSIELIPDSVVVLSGEVAPITLQISIPPQVIPASSPQSFDIIWRSD